MFGFDQAILKMANPAFMCDFSNLWQTLDNDVDCVGFYLSHFRHRIGIGTKNIEQKCPLFSATTFRHVNYPLWPKNNADKSDIAEK